MSFLSMASILRRSTTTTTSTARALACRRFLSSSTCRRSSSSSLLLSSSARANSSAAAATASGSNIDDSSSRFRYLSSTSFSTTATSSDNDNDSGNSIPSHWLTADGFTEFDTLHEMQIRSCRVYADNKLFGTYCQDKEQFEWMTFRDYGDKVDVCRAVLKDLGVVAGNKVAIISNNRWEWAVIAAAAYSMNANAVPMYEAQLPADWTYILNDSGAAVLFCATQEIYDTCVAEVLPATPTVQATLCLNAESGEEHAFATAMSKHEPDVAGRFIAEPAPEDLANLIYTSGTTGKPKGVELTHANFSSNVKAGCRSMVDHPSEMMHPGDVTLAFLPWAHSYGQTCELWSVISHGASMGICRGVPSILEDLQLVRPSVLFAVPTLYKKVYDGVNNLMENASPLRKKLMRTALDVGAKRAAADRGDRNPLGPVEQIKYSVLNKLVLSKIRDRFGGKMRHGFVAGAACPAEVLDFMDAIGIKICEGYGLTETSPIICLNTPVQRQVGSVGRPIGDVTVYVVDEDGKEVPAGREGEICCTGPNVMKGYYKNDAATAEVITTAPDGVSRMFHTGDLGRVDPDTGYVKITGRLKEQYKLENGKYVVPTPIEEAIGLSRFVQQVVLTGANRPTNVVLLVPEWTAIRGELGIDDSESEEDLANDDRVKQLIDSELDRTTAHMKKFEVPTAWAFVAPFTAANNMLTPKMSIRRHKVIEYYAETIDALYTTQKQSTATAESTTTDDDATEQQETPEKKAA